MASCSQKSGEAVDTVFSGDNAHEIAPGAEPDLPDKDALVGRPGFVDSIAAMTGQNFAIHHRLYVDEQRASNPDFARFRPTEFLDGVAFFLNIDAPEADPDTLSVSRREALLSAGSVLRFVLNTEAKYGISLDRQIIIDNYRRAFDAPTPDDPDEISRRLIKTIHKLD